MPVITEQDLKKQLASGELSSFYLLTGEEKLLVKRAARQLIDQAGAGDFPDFNRNEFPGEALMERVTDAAAALPFMAERKCVAVSDLNVEERSQEELDQLYELLDDLPETTVLVLYYPTLETGKKSAKWKKLLAQAEKKGCLLELAHREAPDLRRTLIRAAEKQGCQLDRAGADRLIEYAGTDLNQLFSELDKLCAYTLGRGGTAVTPRLVEELTPKSMETTAFMMVRALVAGEARRTYTLLDTLFYQNEKPVAILGAIAASYLDMYRVKAALESGLTSAAPAEYAPEYKSGKDKKLHFRLRNAENAVRRVSSQALAECLRLLLDADLALKGSQMEPRLVLESLVAKLLLAMQGGGAR